MLSWILGQSESTSEIDRTPLGKVADTKIKIAKLLSRVWSESDIKVALGSMTENNLLCVDEGNRSDAFVRLVSGLHRIRLPIIPKLIVPQVLAQVTPQTNTPVTPQVTIQVSEGGTLVTPQVTIQVSEGGKPSVCVNMGGTLLRKRSALVTPQFTRVISSDPKYRQRVINRLDNLGLHGEEFCDKMEEYKCKSAGSFPTQCLNDEYYDDSDIDIFVSYQWDVKTNFLPPYCEFEQWLYRKYNIKSSPHEYHIRGVLRSRKYQITPKACVNIILVNDTCLDRFILTTCDFSFCQTIFDGRVVKYCQQTLQKIGYIVNRDGFKTKREYHLTEDEYEAKYRNRNMSSERVQQEAKFDRTRIIYDPAKRLASRMDKYKIRGFQIVPHPEGLHPFNTYKELYNGGCIW